LPNLYITISSSQDSVHALICIVFLASYKTFLLVLGETASWRHVKAPLFYKNQFFWNLSEM